MQPHRTPLTLKISGTLFADPDHGGLSATRLKPLIVQLKQLCSDYQVGIVMGGGNIVRGTKDHARLNIDASVAHMMGMLSTQINALFLHNLLQEHGLVSTHLTAISGGTTPTITSDTIAQTLTHSDVLVFSGGTGNPFFSTDTAAILRALQMGAHQVWKATNVAGVFDKDPAKHADAKLLPTVTLTEALAQKLCVMDSTAYALARDHGLKIRIFAMHDTALTDAARDQQVGSTLE